MNRYFAGILLLSMMTFSLFSCEKEANCHMCITYADTLSQGNPFFLSGNSKDTTVCGLNASQSFISTHARIDTEVGYIPTSSGIMPSQIQRTWHASCN